MRYADAVWSGPIPNETPHGMIAHRGLVLHIQEGTEAGTDAWFHNPAAQASAHFGVAKTGTMQQWVDTDDKAWAEAAGNPYWVSIEIEGHSGDSLTGPQIQAIAGLLRWLHGAYGFPLQSTDDPNGTGLGWHGMGGMAWGGHFNCPGDPIKAQRPAILAAAGASQTPAPAVRALPQGAAVFSPPLTVIAALSRETGGGWLLFADGGTGDMFGAPDLGNVHGKPYFVGRTPDHLDYPTTPNELAEAASKGWGPKDCHVTVDTAGERYGPIY